MLLLVTWIAALIASSPLYYSQSLQTLTMENITLCGEVNEVLIIANNSFQFCGEFNWGNESHTKVIYGSGLLIIQFLIPAIIMSFCYWKILQKVVNFGEARHSRIIAACSNCLN